MMELRILLGRDPVNYCVHGKRSCHIHNDLTGPLEGNGSKCRAIVERLDYSCYISSSESKED